MSLESADFIPGLVATNPEGTDPKSQGDDHIRMLKQVLKNQFPAFTGEAVIKTEAQLNTALNQGDFGLGAGVTGGPVVTDANLITLNGFYKLTPPFTNGPSATFHTILHQNYDFSAGQIAVNIGGSGDIWARVLSGTWQPWVRVWTESYLQKQSSEVDTTPGRLMAVGAFGLGGTSPNSLGLDLNSYTLAGFYKLGGALLNSPTANTDLSLLVAGGSGIPFQVAADYATGAIYTRSLAITAWTPWRQLAGSTRQSWQALTGSRALGVTYTNDTQQAIQVSARVNCSVSSSNVVFTVDGLAMNVATAVFGSSEGSFQMLVPPGATYSLSGANLTIQAWQELR